MSIIEEAIKLSATGYHRFIDSPSASCFKVAQISWRKVNVNSDFQMQPTPPWNNLTKNNATKEQPQQQQQQQTESSRPNQTTMLQYTPVLSSTY